MNTFDVPGDWTRHELDGVLRIAAPPEWSKVDDDVLAGAEGVVMAIAAPAEVENVFVMNINLVRGRTAESGETLEQYAAAERDSLAGALNEFQLIDSDLFESNGIQWAETLAAYQGSDDALTMLQRTALIPGSPAIILTATADTNEWARFEGLIVAILASVEVETPS